MPFCKFGPACFPKELDRCRNSGNKLGEAVALDAVLSLASLTDVCAHLCSAYRYAAYLGHIDLGMDPKPVPPGELTNRFPTLPMILRDSIDLYIQIYSYIHLLFMILHFLLLTPAQEPMKL